MAQAHPTLHVATHLPSALLATFWATAPFYHLTPPACGWSGTSHRFRTTGRPHPVRLHHPGVERKSHRCAFPSFLWVCSAALGLF